MSYQQLTSPNLSPTLHQGGNTLTDWYGWCLAYVQTAFNTGWAGSNAMDGWHNHTAVKHQDRAFPSGVYIPVWFDGYGGLGHVAIYKDGQVWSSPWHHKAAFDTCNSIEEVEHIYGVSYIGWSEDLGGTRIVQAASDAPLYTITPITPKQVLVAVGHNEWNLDNPDFNSVAAHPYATADVNHIVTVVAELRHRDMPQYVYYLEDSSNAIGWNTLDCTDYVTPVAPTVYIPPAAPQKGIPAEKYTLLTSLPYYGKPENAMAGKDPQGTLSPTEYFVVAKSNRAYNISTNNMKDLQHWVNTLNNVPPAPVIMSDITAPEDWQSTYKPFADGKSRKYKALSDMFIIDLAGVDKNGGVQVHKGDMVPIFGSLNKNGMTYLIPWLNDVHGVPMKNRFYGVPTNDIYSGVPNLEGEIYRASLNRVEAENRAYRKSVGHETTDDRLYEVQQLLARAVKDGLRVLNGIVTMKQLRNFDKTKR